MAFDLQPYLQGSLINLRPLSSDDFEALYVAASDPLIWEQHPAKDRYKRAVFEKFFLEALESKGALVALDAKTEEIIGSSRFYELDPQNQSVVIGYTFLKRKYWGGVYNREMKRLMLSHAFSHLSEIHFHVGQTNYRSQKALEKIGALKSGSFEKIGLGGVSLKSLIYRIVREEWQTR